MIYFDQGTLPYSIPENRDPGPWWGPRNTGKPDPYRDPRKTEKMGLYPDPRKTGKPGPGNLGKPEKQDPDPCWNPSGTLLFALFSLKEAPMAPSRRYFSFRDLLIRT